MFNFKKNSRKDEFESYETDDPLLGSDSIQDSLEREYHRPWTSILWSGRYLHGGLLLFYSVVYLILVTKVLKTTCGCDQNISQPTLPCMCP